MNTDNPFPGMNPFFEGFCPDVRTTLIGLIRQVASEELPDDLIARAEERIEVSHGGSEIRYRADVALIESPQDVLPPVAPLSGNSVAIAEPEIVECEPVPARWVEIRETGGRLVTVIEVLSPANKRDPDRNAYLPKQQDYLHAGVNLVEIDLLRSGQPALLPEYQQLLKRFDSTTYLIVATRALRPNRREVYYCPLCNRLPAIRVPLRPTDADIPLDVQWLIDRCYRTGRYWLSSRGALPGPPLPVAEENWVMERLREAGLR